MPLHTKDAITHPPYPDIVCVCVWGGVRSFVPEEGWVGNSCSLDLGLGAQAEKELKRCQQQADEVTEIMLNNFDKVLEREGKLAELEQRSDQLLDMVCDRWE